MGKNMWIALALVAGMAPVSWGLEPLRTEGERLFTASGRPVLLRGVTVTNQFWGRWIWPKSDSILAAGGIPMIRYTRTVDWFLDSLDFQHLRELGPNLVRYEFSWELFDSTNAARDSNLQDLHRIVRQLSAQGTYTVLCMSGSPGLDVPKQGYEDAKSGRTRIKSVFESDSVENLWSRTWAGLAQSFRGDSAIAGLELLNEPRLPATTETSLAGASARYLRLSQRIRGIDPTRLVLVPEFNSREANPGETYWSSVLGRNVVDTGEQGVVWTPVWPEIPDTLPNLVSVFHAYFPWDFVDQGIGTYSETEFRSSVKARLVWPRAHRRPVVVTEYGASHKLVLEGLADRRLAWYRQAHKAFAAESLSTTAFTFKGEVDVYTGSNEYSLWAQYRKAKEQVRVVDGLPVFPSSQDQAAAAKNGFDTVLVRWLIQGGQVSDRSCLGSCPILDELGAYFGSNSAGANNRSLPAKGLRTRSVGQRGVGVDLPEGARSWTVVDSRGAYMAGGMVPGGARELRLERLMARPAWVTVATANGLRTVVLPPF